MYSGLQKPGKIGTKNKWPKKKNKKPTKTKKRRNIVTTIWCISPLKFLYCGSFKKAVEDVYWHPPWTYTPGWIHQLYK